MWEHLKKRFTPEMKSIREVNIKQAEAECYRYLLLIEEREKAYQALVEEFPDSAWVYIDWGDMYKDLGDYDQAESIYRLALERNVDDREGVLESLEILEEERESVGRETP